MFCAQVYGFVLSCMLYRDGNTSVAAMETMHTILLSPSPSFSRWLMSSYPHVAMATWFWQEPAQEGSMKEGRELDCGQGGGDGRVVEKGEEDAGQEGRRDGVSPADNSTNSLGEVTV